MGLFSKRNNKTESKENICNEINNKRLDVKNASYEVHGFVPFDDFSLVLKRHLVDSLYYIGLPVGWEPYQSDRFRAKTSDDKTQISITNWKLGTNGRLFSEQEIKRFLEENVIPQYSKYVDEGGYEPYDDLVINENYISKSFKVDKETQYHLSSLVNIAEDKTYLTGFIIRDLDNYSPEMRATLSIIQGTMNFV